MAGARERPQEGPEEEEPESVGEQHCRRGGGEAVRRWARGRESRELQRVFIRYSRASAGGHRKNSRVRMRCWSFDRESGRKKTEGERQRESGSPITKLSIIAARGR